MEIKGQKIVLKTYTLEKCHEFFQNYETDRAMTYDNYIYDKQKVDCYYNDRVLDSSRKYFAICKDNRVIGEIKLKCIDLEKKCGTLSIALINDLVKGKGYGTEAEKLMIEYGVKELGLQIIYADAVHRNHRSVHILRKLGFKHLYDDENLSYFILEVKR